MAECRLPALKDRRKSGVMNKQKWKKGIFSGTYSKWKPYQFSLEMENGNLTWTDDKGNVKGKVCLRLARIGPLSEVPEIESKLYKDECSFFLDVDERHPMNARESDIFLECDSAEDRDAWMECIYEVVAAFHTQEGTELEDPDVAMDDYGEGFGLETIDEDSTYFEGENDQAMRELLNNAQPPHNTSFANIEAGKNQVAHPPKPVEDDMPSISTLSTARESRIQRNSMTPGEFSGAKDVPQLFSSSSEWNPTKSVTLSRAPRSPQLSREKVEMALSTVSLDVLKAETLRLASEIHHFSKDDIRVFQAEGQQTIETIEIQLKSTNNPARRTMRRLTLYAASNGFEPLASKEDVITFKERLTLVVASMIEDEGHSDPVLVALGKCRLTDDMTWIEIIETLRVLEDHYALQIETIKLQGGDLEADDELLKTGRLLTGIAIFPNQYEAEFDLYNEESTRDVTVKLARAVSQLNITESFTHVNCGAIWDSKKNPIIVAIKDLITFLQESEIVMLQREETMSKMIGSLQDALRNKEKAYDSLYEEYTDLGQQLPGLKKEGVEMDDDKSKSPSISASDEAALRREFAAEKRLIIARHNEEKESLVRENQSIRFALNPAHAKSAADIKFQSDKLFLTEKRLAEANRRIEALGGVQVGLDWRRGANTLSLRPDATPVLAREEVESESGDESDDEKHHAHFSPEKWLSRYKTMLSKTPEAVPIDNTGKGEGEPLNLAMLASDASTSITGSGGNEDMKLHWPEKYPTKTGSGIHAAPPPFSFHPPKDVRFDHVQENTKDDYYKFYGSGYEAADQTERVSSGPRAFGDDQLDLKLRARAAAKTSPPVKPTTNVWYDQSTSLKHTSWMAATKSFQMKKDPTIGVSSRKLAPPGFKYK